MSDVSAFLFCGAEDGANVVCNAVVLGVEQKKRPILPSGPSTPLPEKSSYDSDSSS